MPKSSKENSAVPRVTRSLRNRVVSVDNETSGRITPTVKKDLESILENDNKDEQSTTSTQTATPVRGRPRRSSQSEAVSTPVKTPARRLTRRTSLSELDSTTVSSPLRRSTRKASTLAENIVLVEESEHEEEILIEKEATRSSSKSPNALPNKMKTATENIDTKKSGSKGKKSRSPSPLAIQEENENSINKTQSGGSIDKKHNSSILPTVREDMEETQQSQKFVSNTSNEGVKEAEEEKGIIMEKRTTRSSSKSPNSIALENVDTKKRGSKLKKSRSPSPKNSSNITQENNGNEMADSHSSGSEEAQKSQKVTTIDLVKEDKEKDIIIEKHVSRSSSKSPIELLKTAPEAGETKKRGSKGKKSRSPSPFNISTAEESNENQVIESQSNEKSDTNCNFTVLPTVREDSKESQQSPQSFSKAPLSELHTVKENEQEFTRNTAQSSTFSKLAVEIADASSNVTLPMKSPNLEKEQGVVSPTFRRVTRSASKSPVVLLEKEPRKHEKLSKKNIMKDSIAVTSEDKQVVEEPQKGIKSPQEVKKGDLSVTEKETEITETATHVEHIKEAREAAEVAESPKKIIANDHSPAVEVKETEIMETDIQGEAEGAKEKSSPTGPLTNSSTINEVTQHSEKSENGKISLQSNKEFTKTTNEIQNIDGKEGQLFHQSPSVDFNDSSIIMADVSINEIIAKCSDDQKEEEKENRKPEKNHEINILDTNLDKSAEHALNIERVENKSHKSEESKERNNQDPSKNAEEIIIDKSVETSAKDLSNIEQLEYELPAMEHTENIHDNIPDSSLSKSVEHPLNEESISSFSKSSQIVNFNDETVDESILNKTDLLKGKERAEEKPIEDRIEVNKRQKSVVFDTTGDSEKASVNYPKTPIYSKSKSYVGDEEPHSPVDTSITQKITSKRAISLDDSKDSEEEGIVEATEAINDVGKPDTPLKKIKAATILSSTPIMNSKQQNVAGSGSSDRKENTSLPLGSVNKDDKDCFSKSWSQAVIGKAKYGKNVAAFIDAFEHEKKKERDAISLSMLKKSQKDIKKKAESSEDDDEEEDQERNEFLDDEAMEVEEGEESMDSEERRYLEENEVPEHGESIGSEDTDQEEADEPDECGEENSLDSFIASDAESNHELLSVDSAEFSSDESTDEEKKISKKSFNSSRRIQSSEESDQEEEINLKTKKAYKLMIESSDEEDEDANENIEIEQEMQNEGNNLDKHKEQEESPKRDLDTSSTQKGNKEVLSPCPKIEKKLETSEELDEKTNNSIISVDSSYIRIIIKETMDNKQDEKDNSSTAIDKCEINNIFEDKINAETESANSERKSNDDESQCTGVEEKIPNISSKEVRKRSSLRSMSTNKESENLKENGARVIRNLNSSEETLSSTEKTIHSKTLHEDDADHASATNESPILIKEVKAASLSDTELLVEELTDGANIKQRDEVESDISVEHDIEPLEDLHKTKRSKMKNLKKQVISVSFTQSTEVEKMRLSIKSVPKKSKNIKEEKETNHPIQEEEKGGEEILSDEVLQGSSNLKEQDVSNEMYTSDLHLDKIFTESNTPQHEEIHKGKEKDKKPKTPKKSKTLQKSTKNYNPESQGEDEELTLEECSEEDSKISNTIPAPDCSINSAEDKRQWSSVTKETRDLSPILQVLNKSEARLEILIGMKQSINRKIKKMNMKLQQLYGNNSPKSNELLDEYERAIALALKHGLSLLGKQKRKVSRKLEKMNYTPSESELLSEEANSEAEQEPQLKTKRKEKVAYPEHTELIPLQCSQKPSTSRSVKRKRENIKTLAETHEQSHADYRKSLNFIKTTSGLFVEEPTSPEIRKTKKFRITSTLELPIGVVIEEAVTPTSKKVINGFQVTQATPRAIGFKVESILSAGQKEVPSVRKTGIKRKLDLTESTEVLPKPKWMNSGNFSVKKLQSGSSGYVPLNLDESASTHFMVAPLKSKKARICSQAGPSTVKAMEFKARALSNKHIPRESSHNILQRKQKKKANQL